MADDLTGALDAAAEFAADGPVRVLPAPDAAEGVSAEGPLAVVTGNRDRSEEAGRRTAAVRAARLLANGAPAFVKIDSVLRGAPAVEIAAAVEALRPDRIVLAPAFPAQGRITRGGRQHVRDVAGGWRALEPPLVALAPGAAAIGTRLASAPRDAILPHGFHVCDAETEDDLLRIVRAARGGRGTTLFVGTAGLAAALAGAPAPPPPRAAGRTLFVLGTPHPATRRQLDRLAASGSAEAVPLGDPAPMARAVAAAFLAGRDAVMDLSRIAPEGAEPAEAGRLITRLLGRLAPALPLPANVVAGGGATLAAVLAAVGGRAFDALGRVEPGAPRSRIVGGAWEGALVTSRSGGFGDDDLLVRLSRM